MACGGCAEKRAKRAAMREARIEEKRQLREQAAVAEQKALTASEQQK